MTIGTPVAATRGLASGTNTTPMAVPYPTGITAGDKLVLTIHAAQLGYTFTVSDAGFTSAVSRTTNGSSYIYRKDATGSESGTFTVSASAGGRIFAQCMRISGVASKGTGSQDINITATAGSGAAANIIYPSITPTTDNCIVILSGSKGENGSNITGGLTRLDTQHDGTGPLVYVTDYQIQTTKSAIGSGVWTIGTNDTSASRNCVAVVFNAAAVAPDAPTIGTATAGNASASVGFTPPANNGGSAITGYTATSNPGGITGTGTSSPIAVSGLTNGTGYTFTVTATNAAGTSAPSAASNSVTPASSGPSFATFPTLSSATTDGYVFSAKSTGAATMYAVAMKKGSTAPTASQVKTGSPTGFVARVSVAMSAGVTNTLTFTGLTLPVHDVYFILDDGSTLSGVVELAAQLKLPAAGRQYIALSSLSASSPFLVVSPALVSGDVLDIVSKTPAGYNVIVSSGGDVEVDAFGDESRQLLVFNAYDDSAGALIYTSDSTLVVNNQAPTSVAQSTTYTVAKNTAINIPLGDRFDDAENDTQILTELSSLLTPLGLGISGNAITGTTPNAFSDTDHIRIQSQDQYLGVGQTEIRLVVGQQQIPNSAGVLVSDYLDLVRAVGLTTGDVSWQLSISVPKGQVISTSPSYPASAVANSVIDIVGSGAVVPDVRGFTYADALLIAADQGFTLTGGPFEGFVLDQAPPPDSIVDPATQILVLNSGSRYFGVDIGDMQPSDVNATRADFAHAVQVIIDLGVSAKRIDILQAIEAITNYIRSRKFP